MLLDFLFCPVRGRWHLQVNEALRAEGESGGGVAEVPGPARRTDASVSLLAVVSQQGDTTRAVLTPMLPASHQADVADPSTPGLLAQLWCRALTCVKVGSVDARGTIPAGITLALINIHLTVDACKRGQARLD